MDNYYDCLPVLNRNGLHKHSGVDEILDRLSEMQERLYNGELPRLESLQLAFDYSVISGYCCDLNERIEANKAAQAS